MVFLLYVCGKQKAPRRGGGRERGGRGHMGLRLTATRSVNVLWWVGENFAKKKENFENFTAYLGDRQQGFPFFFLFWVVCVALLFKRLTKQERTRPSFAKFTSGVLPPRKKIGNYSPYWKLIRTHFFTCLSIFSLSRSRPPIQSILSPRSTLLLEVGGL